MADEELEGFLKALHIKDSFYLFEQLKSQNDRTVAILIVAYLEDYLARAIKLNMPGANAELRDKLFGSQGTLSTMAAKIDIAAAFGLIDADNRSDYITLTRVRNRFAHNIHVDSFERPEITELCNSFKVNKKLYEEMETDPGPRWRFVDTGQLFVINLHNYYNAAYHDHKDGKRSWLPK